MIRSEVVSTPGLSKGFRLNKKHYIRIFIRDGMHVNPRTGEVNSVKEIAKTLIYGGEGIPARNFLVDGLRENATEIKDVIQGSLAWRFQGMTAEMQYEMAVGPIVYILRSWLKSGQYYRAVEPNAPSTIANKGHDIPLLDSGVLIDSVDGEYV